MIVPIRVGERAKSLADQFREQGVNVTDESMRHHQDDVDALLRLQARRILTESQAQIAARKIMRNANDAAHPFKEGLR
jgi:hypothetical protein